ncbi:unnamed protein product [Caenorhabditis auriculariae]|uniref:Degenerin mec-4/10 cytosolic domain-containing protein n=1 Tax=Caenorhabditis auriculariae TaxID=2777116 RepID=A0A8S1GVR6_9PELO|nr:unnamed protein product [Caenorhabditis auriculariae]
MPQLEDAGSSYKSMHFKVSRHLTSSRSTLLLLSAYSDVQIQPTSQTPSKISSFKTDFSSYLASDTDFLQVAGILTTYAHGESNNANEKEIQCDLLTENGGMEIDPTRLSYKERIRWHLQQFCYKTSSHGIPMLGQAPNQIYRGAWIILLLICASSFINQAVAVINKYNRMDKITDIQLKFDTAPFPAITLCNLNPYKDSLIRSHESTSKILGVFKKAMNKAGGGEDSDKDYEIPDFTIKLGNRRKKRAGDKGSFEPANSVCECEDEGSEECEERSTDEPTEGSSMCICAFDRQTNDAWPCHPKEKWSNTTCQTCDEHFLCSKKAKKGTRRKDINPVSCICESRGLFCIKHDQVTALLNLWEYFGKDEVFADVTDEEVEALGFTNMTDEVAIVTKAKENIIFAMSALSEEQRHKISS